MLKKVARFALWVFVGLALIAGILRVAYKQHKAIEKYEVERKKRCASAFFLDPKQQDACKHERDSPKDYLAWEYTLATWPDGVTAWALIATGFLIAWQASETRKSAEIYSKIFVSTFRPKVIVRSLNLEEIKSTEPNGWIVKVLLVNTGGTVATLMPWVVKFEWSWMSKDPSIFDKKIDGFTIEPGEHRTVDISVPDPSSFGISLYMLNDSDKQTVIPCCSGTIIYVDANGCKRRTGFARGLKTKEVRFMVSSDPEIEYQE